MTTFQINLIGGKAALFILALGAVLIASSPAMWMLVPCEQATAGSCYYHIANVRKHLPSMLPVRLYLHSCMQWPGPLLWASSRKRTRARPLLSPLCAPQLVS